MKKNRSLNIMVYGFILFAFLLIQSCAFNTKLSGLDASARPMEEKKYSIVESSQARSSGFRLLWLFPVTTQADFKEAIDNAINQKGGDNLIDVQYWHEREYWIVGIVDIYTVKGTVIRYEEAP